MTQVETPRATKPLVYVAGPYSRPDPVQNTHQALHVATRLVEEGRVTPIVPHLTLLWHLVTPREITFWYDYDLEVLGRCDALLRLPGASTGADNEVRHAEANGLPVFVSIEDLYEWVR